MASYHLVYFDMRSLGESTRVMFALAGVPYTEERMPYIYTGIYCDEWLTMKANGRSPFGKIPLLELGDGRAICQSGAILRFLANEFGFCPSSNYDKASADMILDSVKDMQTKLDSQFYGNYKNPERREEIRTSVLKEFIPQQIQYLDNILQKNKGGKGYFVGEKITYADIAVFCFLNGYLAGGALEAPNEIKNYPLLVDFYNRVMNEPNILEYLKKRKPNPDDYPY
ncbi:glutathione S-transferase 4 isoform X2 [Exaiptasia diaphana]|uniref:Glutathione S-transferase n=1 Tax=Exaiptasia diaphana TaxID=2652724 RepID=A0A913YD15_EXADI|nr:glutathione S-transferase 4 isoform X2 [Exaiptasia diaphana]